MIRTLRASAVPPHRQRRQFGALVIAQYRAGSCWIAIGDSVAACLHPWHSDANLLRIYDCERVARDTKISPYTLPMGGVGSGSPVKVSLTLSSSAPGASLEASSGGTHWLSPMPPSIPRGQCSSRPQSHKAKRTQLLHGLISLAADPVCPGQDFGAGGCLRIGRFIESTFACRGERLSPTIFLKFAPSQIAST